MRLDKHSFAILLFAGSVYLGAIRLAGAEEPARTWHDDTGKFQIEAALIKVDGDKVELKQSGGDVVSVPVKRLSDADRKYLESLKSNNPFAATIKADASAGDALVMVSINVGADSVLTPGIVFYREGKKAYIAVDQNISLFQPRYESGPHGFVQVPGREPSDAAFTIIWQSPKGRKKVPAELTAQLPQKSRWILAAPQDDLPPPVTINPDIQIIEETRVKVVAYEVDSTTSPPSFARMSESGTIKSIFRGAQGEVTQFTVAVEHIAKLNNALVVTDDGKAVGAIGRAAPLAGGAPDNVAVQTTAQFEYLIQPTVAHIAVAPILGDTHKIQWELVVYLNDPLVKTSDLELLVRRVARSRRAAIVELPKAIDAKRDEWEKFSGDFATVKLTRAAPSEETIPQLLGHESNRHATTWVGRYSIDNDGSDSATFDLQAFSVAKDGRAHFFHPMQVGFYRPIRPGAPAGPSAKIPGLDGRPLNATRPEEHKNGGWQLTSQATRVEQAAPDKPALMFPQPKKSGETTIVNKNQSGQYEIFELKLLATAARPHHWMRRPALFSKDGKWIYAVDGRDVLHKVNSTTLVDEIVLDLGAVCDMLALSKQGLVVGLKSTGSLWVIDPDTLNVIREIPLPNASVLAASPASSIIAVFCNEPTDARVMNIVDVASGQVVHRLTTGRSNSPRVENKRLLDDVVPDMIMSHDGKHLFAQVQQIERYRLEGADLIYEESGEEKRNNDLGFLALSNDDKWVAMNRGTVLDATSLTQVRVRLSPQNTGSIGFDSKTGNIYTAGRNTLDTISPRGGKLVETRLPNDGDHYVIVHPQGERILLWAQGKVMYCDTVSGRTGNNP